MNKDWQYYRDQKHFFWFLISTEKILNYIYRNKLNWQRKTVFNLLIFKYFFSLAECWRIFASGPRTRPFELITKSFTDQKTSISPSLEIYSQNKFLRLLQRWLRLWSWLLVIMKLSDKLVFLKSSSTIENVCFKVFLFNCYCRLKARPLSHFWLFPVMKGSFFSLSIYLFFCYPTFNVKFGMFLGKKTLKIT